VLQPSKELIEQTAAELQACCPSVPVGVYSAGIGRRDTDEPIVVAGIHSVYKRACDLGAFNLVDSRRGAFNPARRRGHVSAIFRDAKLINPRVRICGLTATPFRLSSGPICSPGGILNEICYEVGVRELIVGGFISRLRTPRVDTRIDLSGVHVRGGEYIAGELENGFRR
jgi:DNA repair protein RadD